MKLSYKYRGAVHSSEIDWTENGRSVVFQRIRKELMNRHEMVLDGLEPHIKCLDELADTLYKQIHSTPQHKHNTYNPALPKILERILSELTDTISNLPADGQGGIFRALCGDVMAVFRKMADVYLEENKYHGKMLKRDNRAEKYEQNIVDASVHDGLAQDFENVVLQMNDLSNVLDCLTKTQKRRLVQHVILGYTITRIAEIEGSAVSTIHESIKSALTKLKENYR